MIETKEMPQGDYVVLTFTVTDRDTIEDSTIKWQLSESKEGDPEIEKTTDDDIIINKNKFWIRLDSADTEELEGKYYHEAEIKDADGRPNTVYQGLLNFKPTLIK